jgi:hypothetical protein
VPITEIATTLNERDGYDMNATDWEELEQQWRWDLATQLMARFLIDREGIVRWVDIEGGGQAWPASASSRRMTNSSPPCGHSSAADALIRLTTSRVHR